MSIYFLGLLILLLVMAAVLIVAVLNGFVFNKGKGGGSSSIISQTPLNSNSVYNAPYQTAGDASNGEYSSNTKVCPNCNTPIGDGMYFCMMCGTKVK